MPRIIDDGQSIDFYLKSPDGDDFYGTRRPTLPADRDRAQARARRAEKIADWDEHNAAYNDLIATKLIWWNVLGADDKPAPVNAKTAGALPPDLWDRLTNVVLGYDWGDLPPDATPEQKAEFEKAIAAQKAGRIPGDVVAGDDAKKLAEGARFALRNPNLPDCGICQKYLVDYEWVSGRGTGQPKPDPREEGKFLPRTIKHGPPPCGTCPKKGPQFEHLYQLSEKNWRAVAHYRRHRATFGRGLSEEEANDSVVQRNFTILEQVFAEADREQLGEEISRSLLPRVK